jgi:hypothetical protein
MGLWVNRPAGVFLQRLGASEGSSRPKGERSPRGPRLKPYGLNPHALYFATAPARRLCDVALRQSAALARQSIDPSASGIILPDFTFAFSSRFKSMTWIKWHGAYGAKALDAFFGRLALARIVLSFPR